jgi:hypothetical protein
MAIIIKIIYMLEENILVLKGVIITILLLLVIMEIIQTTKMY